MLHLENTYHLELPTICYSNQIPVTVKSPKLVYFNKDLAVSLDLESAFTDQNFTQDILSGKEVISATQPIAQAYAGHQFGHFNKLGDGRAILLGEHIINNERFDIQLKGAGATKFSRNGDGRATFYAMLREYLISEAMHGLGVETTRSLAVVKTGEPVYREQAHDGAVLTRIAKSHIRVGTFEYARFFGSEKDLEQLTKYTIKRHYPDLLDESDYALKFFEAVMLRQVNLIVDWMRVGFIHGVMNTDNMSISGETIDYGPCAFMNAYHPKTVFSSIDRQSRYAFGNQPQIAHWNLSVFANSLLPLIHQEEEIAVSKIQECLTQFPVVYKAKYFAMMCNKLGIVNPEEKDAEIVQEILELLVLHQVDYTNFFTQLKRDTLTHTGLLNDEKFKNWKKKWELVSNRLNDKKVGVELMNKVNPEVIPRNHLVEEALLEATRDNFIPFDDLLDRLKKPYNRNEQLQEVPHNYDEDYQTFCGT